MPCFVTVTDYTFSSQNWPLIHISPTWNMTDNYTMRVNYGKTCRYQFIAHDAMGELHITAIYQRDFVQKASVSILSRMYTSNKLIDWLIDW